jgi:hypothetical protein
VFVMDAFSLLADTIEKFKIYRHMKQSPKISCEDGEPWLDGHYLMSHLKRNNFKGLSGHIQFDQQTGYRKNLTLAIVDKTKSGVDLFGYWRDINAYEEKSIEVIRSYAKEKVQVLDKLNRSLIVTTKLVSVLFYFTFSLKDC